MEKAARLAALVATLTAVCWGSAQAILMPATPQSCVPGKLCLTDAACGVGGTRGVCFNSHCVCP